MNNHTSFLLSSGVVLGRQLACHARNFVRTLRRRPCELSATKWQMHRNSKGWKKLLTRENVLSFAGPRPLKMVLDNVVGCHHVWRAAPDSFRQPAGACHRSSTTSPQSDLAMRRQTQCQMLLGIEPRGGIAIHCIKG